MTPRRALTAAVAILASVMFTVIITTTTTTSSQSVLAHRDIAYQTQPSAGSKQPINVWAAGNNAIRASEWIGGLVRAERINAFRAWIAALPKPPPPQHHVVHAVSATSVTTSTQSFTATGSVNGYPCGGSLPSCCTLSHESGGRPTADNGHGYTGLWQFGTTTWQHTWTYTSEFGSVASWVLQLAGVTSPEGVVARWPVAKDAPPDVQNEAARRLYRNGAGASNWYGDGCYGGR